MRIIAHLDMDAFFAAVEERERPRLRGHPIVVGADPESGKGRGVVSTANYKARAYGIYSALPISKAWFLSEEAKRKGKPPAVFIAGNFELYESVSTSIEAIIKRHAPMSEMASIDEMYFDLSHIGSWKKARELCLLVKKEIFMREHLTASIGLGPNKLIAKIASDREKPNGFTEVMAENVSSFLSPLMIRVIPGIGPKSEAELHRLHITTVSDLRETPEAELVRHFGKLGSEMARKARGEDDEPVGKIHDIKSIGSQHTFAKDTRDLGALTQAIKKIANEIFANLKLSGFNSFRTAVLTVRFDDFSTVSTRTTFGVPVSKIGMLEFEAFKLLMPFLDVRKNSKNKKIRLLGVRVEKLGGPVLF